MSSQEYAPTASPIGEAVVHRPESTLSADVARYLTPAEQDAYDALMAQVELRKKADLLEKKEYITTLGAEAVIAVTATEDSDKRLLVAENFLRAADQQLDNYSPADRQFIVDDVLSQLQTTGNERIDQGILRVLAYRTAQVQTLTDTIEEHNSEVMAYRQGVAASHDLLVESFQGDPDNLSLVEEALDLTPKDIELIQPPKIPAEVLSTAEVEIAGQFASAAETQQSNVKPHLIRELGSRVLARLRPGRPVQSKTA